MNKEEIREKLKKASFTNIEPSEILETLISKNASLEDIGKACNSIYLDDNFSSDQEPYKWIRSIYELVITKAIKEFRPSVEYVKFENEEIHAFGIMPNTNKEDWYFIGFEGDFDSKGLHGLGIFIV